MYSFKGGVHPPEHKELTSDKKITPIPQPKVATIPLLQHVGSPCQATVQKGDSVKKGTLVGKSEKFISAHIHSSISGRVKSIQNTPHPVIGRFLSVLIENDGEDSAEKPISEGRNIEELTPEEMRKSIRDAGIVGLGGAAFPTHVKLSPPKEKVIDTFIANGAECEPFLTCDHRLIVEKGEEIIKGIKIVQKILKPQRCIVAIEENKPDAIDNMRRLTEKEDIEVVSLKVRYPQGGEKQLIRAILGREVPSGGLPMDVGVVVHNVGTLFSIYEAVYLRKSLYERVITVTGEVEKPGNYLVRIGTPIRDIVDFCGADVERVGAIICGGPMMGVTQSSLDAPVIKGTTAILLQGKNQLLEREESPCIRCGRCVDVCPAYLIPTQIAKFVRAERWEKLGEFHIKDCIECGCCGYICPSNIPLVQYIKLGKSKMQ
ncbi:MAG TPA: electron transport complex subunit RsxC [Candidatus Omnitrophica bacterium]|nr:electron transport complex subunit RsxC [Candidatus Omnitrophota bacterium]